MATSWNNRSRTCTAYMVQFVHDHNRDWLSEFSDEDQELSDEELELRDEEQGHRDLARVEVTGFATSTGKVVVIVGATPIGTPIKQKDSGEDRWIESTDPEFQALDDALRHGYWPHRTYKDRAEAEAVLKWLMGHLAGVRFTQGFRQVSAVVNAWEFGNFRRDLPTYLNHLYQRHPWLAWVIALVALVPGWRLLDWLFDSSPDSCGWMNLSAKQGARFMFFIVMVFSWGLHRGLFKLFEKITPGFGRIGCAPLLLVLVVAAVKYVSPLVLWLLGLVWHALPGMVSLTS